MLRAVAAVVLASAMLAAQPVPLAILPAATLTPGTRVAPGMLLIASHPSISAEESYTVIVRDSSGTARNVAPVSTSVGSLTFVAPQETALGPAAIAVRGTAQEIGTAELTVAAVSPGIFTASGDGTGAPLGYRLAGGDLFQSVAGGWFLPRPFAAGGATLILAGSGFRGWRTGLSATVAEMSTPVAVTPSEQDGIDQLTIGPLPPLTDARGEVELIVTADGVASNAVRLAPNSPALGQWTMRAELLEPNSEYAVGEVRGKIYVLGGYPASRVTQRTVQVYDPVSDRWEITAPMPLQLNHNMAAAVNGKLYVIGGQTTDAGAGNFSDRVFEYDPETREWRERARMPTARGGGVAAVVEGKIYVRAAAARSRLRGL